MKNIKISQIQGRNGVVKNQFIIKQNDIDGDLATETFQSYDSIIAIKDYTQGIKKIILDKSTWDYSTTTGKYRNLFLGETKKETQAKIDSGIYELANLN